MAKKNIKSEVPKKKRPISLNILEIAKRLQKIEEISDTPYTLPTASADTKGGVKVGNGLSMTGEVLSANPVSAYDVSYDNTDSGLTADKVKGAIDELAITPRRYKVIATFTGNGVKTYADVITAFLPYTNQADLLIDASNIYYPRNTAAYFSANISSSGSVVIYAIRFDATNPYWKTISVGTGAEVDYMSQAVPSDRVIQLCKKL